MKSRFRDVTKTSMINALLLLGVMATAPALAQLDDHPAWPDGSLEEVPYAATAEALAAPDLSVVASLVGDRDDFGFNGSPKSCSSFDNRTAGDHAAFDVSAPGGTQSGCQFEGTWTHTFAVPPDGVAHFAIRIPEIMADDSRWGCNFQENAERMTLDGAPAYGFLPAGVSCTATTIYTQSFWGAQANAIAGDGSISVWYTQGGDEFALDYSEIIDVWAPVEIRAVSGNGQRGVIGGPVDEPLEVELITSNPSILAAKVPVTFELIGPRGSSGGGISWGNGNPDTVGPTTNTAYADANGRASVRVVLGDKEGEYIVRARSGMSITDTPVDFVLTARKPASVRIIKDEPDTAYLEDSYAISSVEPTSFYAVGLDESGNKIGRVRSTWTVKAGRPAGAATLTYDATFPTSTNTVTPTTAGRVDVAAKPVVKGVQTASSSLYIVGVVISLTGDATQNHIWSFVPGSKLNGGSVPLPADPADPIQRVNLFLQTGTSSKGQITIALENTTSYPGVAMNYPINSLDRGPDLTLSTLDNLSVEGSSLPTEPFAKDGVSGYILNVRDFGAAGKLRVTIKNGRDQFTFLQQLPIDRNKNGLPDFGWTATAPFHVSDDGQKADDDIDDDPTGAGDPFASVWGDGLSVYEEYRGFVALGIHTRLNPRRKDLFILADEEALLEMDAFNILRKLPLAVHYVRSGEVVGIDVPDRAADTKPLINSNREGVPGASPLGQRGIRVVYQALNPPVVQDKVGNVYEVWKVQLAGIAIPDAFKNVTILNHPTNPKATDPANAHLFNRGPNQTQWVEVYPEAFERMGMHTDFGANAYYDENGVPVPDCAVNNYVLPCDAWDTANNMMLPTQEAVPDLSTRLVYLRSRVDPARATIDYYSRESYRCSEVMLPGGLPREEMKNLMRAIVGHEVAHGLHVEHDLVSCGDLMYDAENTGATRKSMARYYPIPDDYSRTAIDQIRLFDNP